jgi:hypothetical protein
MPARVVPLAVVLVAGTAAWHRRASASVSDRRRAAAFREHVDRDDR